MKTSLRILSVVLTLTMLIGLMPMAAFAAEATDVTQSTETTEATQVTETTEATDNAKATEGTETTEASKVTEATESSKAPETIEDTTADSSDQVDSGTPSDSPAKKPGQASVTMDGWIYGKDAKKPVFTSETHTGVSPVISYKNKDGSDADYTDKVPANAGTYTVRVTYPETETHLEVSATADFTIAQATVSEITLGNVDFLARAYNGTTTLEIPKEPQLPVGFTVGNESVAPALDRDYDAELVLLDAKPDTDPKSTNARLTITLKESGNYVLDETYADTLKDTKDIKDTKDVKFITDLHIDIKKVDITITAVDQILPEGEKIAADTTKVNTTPTLVNGDALTQVTLTEEIPEGQKDGIIKVSDAIIKNGDADHTEYYNISYVSGKSIHSAAVTQAPAAHGDLVYNGAEQKLVTAGTAERGTMEYSLVSPEKWTQEIPTAKNAGEYKIYYRAKGAEGYADSTVADLTVKIAPKSVTATATAEKPYDGNDSADACMKIQVPQGAFGEEKVKIEGIKGSTFASKLPGQHQVTPGTVKLSGADANNYVVTINPFQGTITNPEKPVIATAPEANTDLVYNGNSQPLLKFPGEAAGGTIWYRANGIDWTSVPLNATSAGKYNVEYQVAKVGAKPDPDRVDGTVVAAIAPKPLTATATAEKVYDGNVFTKDADIDFTLNRDGVIGKDQVEIQSIEDSTFKTANVGTNIPIIAGHVKLVGADAGNYIVTVENFTGKITPKPITVTAPSLSKRYGQVDPSLKPTAKDNGLVGNDKLEGKLARAEGEDVGVYAITQGTVTNENNPNYDITFQDGKLTVQPAKSAMKIKLSRTSAVPGRDVTITVTIVNGEENLMTENWKQPTAPRLLVGSKDLELEATDTVGVWKCTYRVPKDAKGSLVFTASAKDDTGNYLNAEVSAKLKIGTSISPLTGDQRNPALYATVAGVAAGVLIVLLLVNKKKKNSK